MADGLARRIDSIRQNRAVVAIATAQEGGDVASEA
jgi:hypothetical protein